MSCRADDLPDATEPIDAAVPDAALQDVVPDEVADTLVGIATDTVRRPAGR
jgi:hypothetical protein